MHWTYPDWCAQQSWINTDAAEGLLSLATKQTKSELGYRDGSGANRIYLQGAGLWFPTPTQGNFQFPVTPAPGG